MSSPLHLSPQALLGALQLKVQGQNPNEFGATVTPIIDVYDQYLTDRVFVSNVAANVATPLTTGAVITAPTLQTETWRILGIGCYALLAAGDAAIDVTLGVQMFSPAGVTFPYSAERSITGTLHELGVYLPVPFWLPKGWSVRATAELAAAPAANWSLGVRVLCARIVD